MSKLFDSHAHYTDRRFDTEYPGGAEALLDLLLPVEVGCIINVSTNLDNAAEVIAQSARYGGMYAAVGIHPEDIKPGMSLGDEMSRLRGLLEEAGRNKIVALGEIGFDYFWKPLDKEIQHEYFDAQMALAAETSFPVIVHDREAHGDVLDMLRRYPSVRGVLHSFSGSAEMAREVAALGWYISFSGVLTFKNARRTLEAAEAVPRERILIETDAPYLAPHPYRGELNHSGLMRLVAERLGELLGMTTEQAISLSAANAAALFGVGVV